MSNFMLFTGNSNPDLAVKIAHHLGCDLGKAKIDNFSDGETRVEILEHVRGREIFLLQSTCAPTNDNFVELILMADALRRSSADSIIAVIPYFGYARQDRRVRSARVPITAKVIADVMAAVGISHLVTVDLHADQIQGFFYMPVDNVYSTPVILDDIQTQNLNNLNNVLIVSPDVGGVVRARAIAKRLNDTELAIIDKRRPKPSIAEVMHIIGDVKDRHCVIIDDIIDTASTLCQAAKALKKHGALSVRSYVTHPVLSGNAIENIMNSDIDEIVVSDTIPLRDNAKKCIKIRQVSLSAMLAEAIRRIAQDESVSSMFPE